MSIQTDGLNKERLVLDRTYEDCGKSFFVDERVYKFSKYIQESKLEDITKRSNEFFDDEWEI